MASTERDRGSPSSRAVALGISLALVCSASGCRTQGKPDAGASAALHWQAALVDRSVLSAPERADLAASVLREDRWERTEDLHQRTLEAAWRVALGASPQRIVSGVHRVFRGVRRFRKPTDQEEVALRWLTPHGPELPPEGAALYRQLHARARGRLAELGRDRAESAIDAHRFDLARRLLTRALELEPGAADTAELLATLGERERQHDRREPRLTLRTWDVPLAAELVSGSLGPAHVSPTPERELDFVAAAALLLQGQHEAAREGFLALADAPDPLGPLASRWLERPDVDVDGELARAVHGYRVKRLLGWIGGNALAERGTSFTMRSFDVWKNAFTLSNMGVSLPARLVRGWKPDGQPVREAALHYLERKPSGPQAGFARSWLDQVGWPDPDALGFQASFPLPSARSQFERLRLLPVIVSRGAVASGHVTGSSTLLSALEDAPAARLEVHYPPRPVAAEDELELDGFPFARDTARRLLDELAAGIERDHFRWSLETREAALERLRELDAALERGGVLYAESWSPPDLDLLGSFSTTALEGTDQRGALALERGDDDMVAVSDVGNELRACPRDILCIDRERFFRTALYGYAGLSSGAGLGFQSSTKLLGMGLGMTESGPEASLVLPIGRWLAIDAWLPLEAELSLGADPYIGPVLRKKKCSDALENPDEASVRRLLPLGLRSRCVIRLY